MNKAVEIIYKHVKPLITKLNCLLWNLTQTSVLSWLIKPKTSIIPACLIDSLSEQKFNFINGDYHPIGADWPESGWSGYNWAWKINVKLEQRFSFFSVYYQTGAVQVSLRLLVACLWSVESETPPYRRLPGQAENARLAHHNLGSARPALIRKWAFFVLLMKDVAGRLNSPTGFW